MPSLEINTFVLIGIGLLCALYLSLFIFYIAVRHEKGRLTKARDTKELSTRTINFLAKYDFSKENVLHRLKADKERMTKSRILFTWGIILPCVYFFLRMLPIVIFGCKINFPNYSDYFAGFLLLIAINVRLWWLLLLSFNRVSYERFEQLLENISQRDMRGDSSKSE
jgi:hypothetical protein